MNTKFYICRTCGNIIEKINDSCVPVVCCGKKMEELIPDAALIAESGAGHFAYLERAEKFGRIILSFLTEGR